MVSLARRSAALAQLQHGVVQHDGQVPLAVVQRADAHVAPQHRHGQLRALLLVRQQRVAGGPLGGGELRVEVGRLGAVPGHARADGRSPRREQRRDQQRAPEEHRVLPAKATAYGSWIVHPACVPEEVKRVNAGNGCK
jgi:hypothetical protein